MWRITLAQLNNLNYYEKVQKQAFRIDSSFGAILICANQRKHGCQCPFLLKKTGVPQPTLISTGALGWLEPHGPPVYAPALQLRHQKLHLETFDPSGEQDTDWWLSSWEGSRESRQQKPEGGGQDVYLYSVCP